MGQAVVVVLLSDGAGLSPVLSPFQFVLKNYGENPENYNEELRKLEVLRQVSQHCWPQHHPMAVLSAARLCPAPLR